MAVSCTVVGGSIPILAGRGIALQNINASWRPAERVGCLQNTTARIAPWNKVYSSSDGDGVVESIQVASYHRDNPRLQDLPATGVVATAPSAAQIQSFSRKDKCH